MSLFPCQSLLSQILTVDFFLRLSGNSQNLFVLPQCYFLAVKLKGMGWTMGLVKEEYEISDIKKPGGPEKECKEIVKIVYLMIISKHNIGLSVFNNKAAAY